ncbi:MAG: hypothetical protein NTU53_21465 [Planctomycetota bacterium]|nr:hypothetical protein [Planctomycetota bacterium]
MPFVFAGGWESGYTAGMAVIEYRSVDVQGKHGRGWKTWVIAACAIGILAVLVGGGLRWFGHAVWGFLDPVTDPAQYQVPFNEQKGHSYFSHFPSAIPSTAKNVQFLYQRRFGMGALLLRLRYKASPVEVQQAIQRFGSQATTMPTDRSYPFWNRMPPTFQVMLLGADESDDRNHGHSFGVAVDVAGNEIVYWAEQW